MFLFLKEKPRQIQHYGQSSNIHTQVRYVISMLQLMAYLWSPDACVRGARKGVIELLSYCRSLGFSFSVPFLFILPPTFLQMCMVMISLPSANGCAAQAPSGILGKNDPIKNPEITAWISLNEFHSKNHWKEVTDTHLSKSR